MWLHIRILKGTCSKYDNHSRYIRQHNWRGPLIKHNTCNRKDNPWSRKIQAKTVRQHGQFETRREWSPNFCTQISVPLHISLQTSLTSLMQCVATLAKSKLYAAVGRPCRLIDCGYKCLWRRELSKSLVRRERPPVG